MSDNDLTDRLYIAVADGQLMSWLTDINRTEIETNSAFSCLAEMHRLGRIDVLSHLGRPEGVPEWQLDYATWHRVYLGLLPLIEDKPSKIAKTVESLAQGTWGPMMDDAFTEWLRRDQTRVNRVLDLCDDVGMPVKIIAMALITGMQTRPQSHTATAISYLYRGRLRMPGTRAIANMASNHAESCHEAVSALNSLINDETQLISDRAAALAAALECGHKFGRCLNSQILGIVNDSISFGDIEFLRECALALARFSFAEDDAVLTALLQGIAKLNTDSSTLRSITDSALYGMLSRGSILAAVPSLEAILLRGEGVASLESLGSTAYFIAHKQELLAQVVSRWFRSGELTLCNAARYLVSKTGAPKFEFSFNPSNGAWPNGMTAYVARKAVGWLMPDPIAPTSFLMCLLPEACDAEAEIISELLYYPILVNYPLAARTYIEERLAHLPERARAYASAALEKNRIYMQRIEDVGYLPEMQPSEHHRWIERQRQSEEFAEASEEARKGSELLNIFEKQTVLHGLTVICHVRNPDGSTRQIKNRLGTISVSVENPMAWTYDPVELDYRLRMLRIEKLPQ